MPFGPLSFSSADRIAARPIDASQTRAWNYEAQSTVGHVRPSVPPPSATEAPAAGQFAVSGREARAPEPGASVAPPSVPPGGIEAQARDLLLQESLRSSVPPPLSRADAREQARDAQAAARRTERRRQVQHYAAVADALMVAHESSHRHYRG